MQNRYVADVGDFGKFQLFRYLFNHKESPLDGKALAQGLFSFYVSPQSLKTA